MNAVPPTHHVVVGSTRESRRRTAEMVAADVVADCHRRLRGPYSGTVEILCRLVPDVLERQPGLVRAHDIELLTLAPELKDHLQPSRETLTSLAVPKERTRYYAANRTRRLAHGIVEFLNEYVRSTGRLLTLAFDNVHEADPNEQELLAILLRRADPEYLTLVVGTDGSPLPDELAGVLRERAGVVVAPPLPTSEGRRDASVEDLGRRYVWSDGTSDDPAELAAYEVLPPQQRAALHDARADELATQADFSATLGAIPYHREHGSAPATAGGDALYAAIRHCLDFGFYPAVRELGRRALHLVDPEERQTTYLEIGFMMANALVGMLLVDEAEALSVDLRNRSTDPMVHLSICYLLGMIQTRYRDPEERDHRLGRAYLHTAIALTSQLTGPDAVFHQAFQRNGLALVELHAGDLDKAYELVDWGIRQLDERLAADEHRLHRSVLLHNRAQVNLARGRIAEGIADLDRVIATDPKHPEYHFDRGNLHRRLGDHEAALADYERAIALSPPFAELHYNRADLLAVMGETAAAIDEFGYVIELEPDHLDARINRAALRFESGDLAGTMADVREGLVHHPGDPFLLCTQGLVLRERGESEAALASFTAALESDPTKCAALSNRATVRFELGDVDGAIDDLARALELDPDNADLRYNRGFAYQSAGRHREAIEDFSLALELPGADAAELLHRRGTCFAAIGERAQAAADLRASLDAGGTTESSEAEALLRQLLTA